MTDKYELAIGHNERASSSSLFLQPIAFPPALSEVDIDYLLEVGGVRDSAGDE
jgi:hypothetical protein